MALSPGSPPCSLPIRLIASRLFSTSSLKSHNTLSRLFFNARRNLRTWRAFVGYPTKNAGVFRAFMSSSLALEAFQKKSDATAYSSEQIQGRARQSSSQPNPSARNASGRGKLQPGRGRTGSGKRSSTC